MGTVMPAFCGLSAERAIHECRRATSAQAPLIVAPDTGLQFQIIGCRIGLLPPLRAFAAGSFPNAGEAAHMRQEILKHLQTIAPADGTWMQHHAELTPAFVLCGKLGTPVTKQIV